MTGPVRLDRQTAAAKPGIVHLGPGAFFKAFNAIYTDDVLTAEGGDWGIIAVSLQSDRAARELGPQGGVFTSVELAPEGGRTRVIGSLCKVLVAPEDHAAVLAALTDPAIRIVSLTITEKGYFFSPATGDVRLDAQEVQADLARPDIPTTAIGFIVEALARRRAAGHRPFTVLSCDNLPDNGAVVRRVILGYARARDAELADWIAQEGRFPSTMVDRITPATTAEDVARLAARVGYEDPACVQHEPFRQWIIQDDFVDWARPNWDLAGAQFVPDVAAHEKMKLCCLNGTHSALAYLGYLAGYQTIAETVAAAEFARFCTCLWGEILPTIDPPQGVDLQDYTDALLARYRNPAIRHRTWQIAMDGSQKLPQRILGTVRDSLRQGRVPGGLCLAVAAWMVYVGGRDGQGAVIDVRDPLAEELRQASDAAEGHAGKVAALLAFDTVFDPALGRHAAFRDAVTVAYEMIAKQGAFAAVAAYVSDPGSA